MPDDDTAHTINATKAWGYAKDVLSIAVIPLVIWGIKLEVGNAQRDLKIDQLQEENRNLKSEDIARLERRIDDNANIDDKVQALALKQATFEGKLDTALGRMDEIKALLR